MYKPADKTQKSFLDFDQPMGMHMNPHNRWIQVADKIPWDLFEIKYADLFPSDTGNVAKALRMALGSLIIQNRFQYSDRERGKTIWLLPKAENTAKSRYGRLEKVSFDAYNESGCLIGAVERYRSRTGHYPERVLADQIYRTRDNRAYCKKHGIRLSVPKLGRPSPNAQTDKKQEYKAQMRLDNTDRIEVERYFSRSKRCYGLGCIVTKLEETQLTSIALSVFMSNLFRIQKRILLRLFWQCFKYVSYINGYSLKAA